MRRRQANRLAPDYWRLWWAASISNIGDRIRLTALPLLIATITRDPIVVTGVTAATTVEFITNDALGGPVGAWLFAAMAALPFGIDSASFLLGAFLVGRIRTPLQSPPDRHSATIFESIKDGVVFVRHHALRRGLAFAVSAANFALGGVAALLALFTLKESGTSEFQFGLVVGVGALGGFVGVVGARWLRRRIRGQALGLIYPESGVACCWEAEGMLGCLWGRCPMVES